MNHFDPSMIRSKESGYHSLLASLSTHEGEISGIVVGFIFTDGNYGTAWASPAHGEAPSKLEMIGLLEVLKAELSAEPVVVNTDRDYDLDDCGD